MGVEALDVVPRVPQEHLHPAEGVHQGPGERSVRGMPGGQVKLAVGDGIIRMMFIYSLRKRIGSATESMDKNFVPPHFVRSMPGVASP